MSIDTIATLLWAIIALCILGLVVLIPKDRR